MALVVVGSLQFGVMLPHRWHYASRENIADYAMLAEKLGFDHVWVTDHIGVPPSHQERGHIFYEALATLSYVAAVTNRVKLGTCVLVASARNPLLTAKQISTIDRMSEGRFILGLGTGWIKEELRAFGLTQASRLDYLKEFIEVIRLAWTLEGPVSYEGKFFRFKDLLLEPKPAQPRIPILLGGNTPASALMGSRLGDGWIPWAIDTGRLKDGKAVLGEKPVFLSGPIQLGEREPRYKGALGEEHFILSGSETDIARRLEEYVDVGVSGFVLSFRDIRLFKDYGLDLIKNQTKRFAEGIMKSFR
jgi:probable F420-dependent oxidoreductase